jgi:hypothetical protein
MARRRHGRRRRRLGSIITVKRLSGAERLSNPSSTLGAFGPAALGGATTILGAVGVKQLVAPTAENAPVVNNADAVGLVLGLLVSGILWVTTSKPAGIAAAAGSAIAFAATKLPAMMSGMSMMPAGTSGIRGMGAIVAQQMNGARRGMGAVVMQPAAAGSYGPGGGESVNLSGLSAVIPGAFGTPTFRMR